MIIAHAKKPAPRQYSFHYNTKPPPLHTKCCNGGGGIPTNDVRRHSLFFDTLTCKKICHCHTGRTIYCEAQEILISRENHIHIGRNRSIQNWLIFHVAYMLRCMFHFRNQFVRHRVKQLLCCRQITLRFAQQDLASSLTLRSQSTSWWCSAAWSIAHAGLE